MPRAPWSHAGGRIINGKWLLDGPHATPLACSGQKKFKKKGSVISKSGNRGGRAGWGKGGSMREGLLPAASIQRMLNVSKAIILPHRRPSPNRYVDEHHLPFQPAHSQFFVTHRASIRLPDVDDQYRQRAAYIGRGCVDADAIAFHIGMACSRNACERAQLVS